MFPGAGEKVQVEVAVVVAVEGGGAEAVLAGTQGAEHFALFSEALAGDAAVGPVSQGGPVGAEQIQCAVPFKVAECRAGGGPAVGQRGGPLNAGEAAPSAGPAASAKSALWSAKVASPWLR